MSKITKIERKESEFKGVKKTSYIGTLDDGTSGYFNPKFDTEFREGDDVSYTKAEKTGKNGTYFVLTLTKLGTSAQSAPKPTLNPQIHVGTGKSKEEMKAEASIRLIIPFIDAFLENKIESGEIAIKHKEFSKLIQSEIDEIYSGK